MKAHAIFFLTSLVLVSGQGPLDPDLWDDDGPVEELMLNNGLNRGEWGPTELCKNGSWVTSFEIKYAAEGHVDDSGVNAVKVYCQDKAGSMTDSLISKEGLYGVWMGIRSCTIGQFMTGMRADIMQDQGTFGDDEGVVNMEMKCSDGTILNGRYGLDEKKKNKEGMDVARETIVVDGREMEAVHVQLTENEEVDELSLWAECSFGNRICGLATEVEHESTLTDDAGLCNLVMYCCNA